MSNKVLKQFRHSIAHFGRMLNPNQKNLVQGGNAVIAKKSSFHVKEAYKVLRTNLIFSLPTEECKKIVITSALPSEGKSTTSINLAITFAETGAKILLIDADLRRPNIAKLMGASSTPGLSNALVKLNMLQDIINHSVRENLDIIYAGNIPPNPAELLGSQAMRDLLEELAPHYDYIFLDTAPVNLVADTSILSKSVSGVVMVVQRNESEKDVVKEAVEQLEFVGAKILGLVLNRMKYDEKKYLGYKRRGYYRYGYYRYGYYRYSRYYGVEQPAKGIEKEAAPQPEK